MSFDGKVVIVTGGAQGIGMAVSTAFVNAGASVVIVDIDEEAGREHLARLQRLGSGASFIHADVSRESDVQNVAQQVIRTYGAIHVLVNNAGVFDRKSIFERDVSEWDRVISINLRGPYMMAKYCGQAIMKAGNGVIINIASTRALMSEADTEPYAASKGGLLALTHSLAISLGPQVRVNAISPGWIEVSDWKKRVDKQIPVHSTRDRLQHPAGRVGKPEDIAQACLFLADEKASFITGVNLVIDGGMTVKMIYEE
ncbi:glucose 1-dehydrogenase [Sulfoacidibacillus thermotolerans]|uniref:Oxidoreductase n=1 Tax=Sulfoacidibacillus thermotolerans TaxID=1765684 RepID=A0A2U3D7G3_SULT2|nr:glucose 1-dehydrogenase [Sulfoacidibacillus thermotolerans]PWI57224.1 oxidoreductase [Sulfoacidibacillus thermotolerans]